MAHVPLTWVVQMHTSDQMQICVDSISKFLGLIAEDLIYHNWVVMCGKIRVHHYDPLTKQQSKDWKWKNEPREKKDLAGKVGGQGHANGVLWPLGFSLSCIHTGN